MSFNDISVFFGVLLAFCGGVSVIIGAITGVVKLKEMLTKKKEEKDQSIENTIAQHTTDIKELKEDMKIVKADVNESKDANALLLKGVKALMNNAITGNGVDILKSTRDEIDNFLLTKVKR